jgi:hypothetical protein
MDSSNPAAKNNPREERHMAEDAYRVLMETIGHVGHQLTDLDCARLGIETRVQGLSGCLLYGVRFEAKLPESRLVIPANTGDTPTDATHQLVALKAVSLTDPDHTKLVIRQRVAWAVNGKSYAVSCQVAITADDLAQRQFDGDTSATPEYTIGNANMFVHGQKIIRSAYPELMALMPAANSGPVARGMLRKEFVAMYGALRDTAMPHTITAA